MNQTLDFFSRQFERQIAELDYRLNPFEELALKYVRGRVLDLGCGLGNLSIAAARLGHSVTAIDACPNAVADLQRRASLEGIPLSARCEDMSVWRAQDRYDTVVAIGLLMFFPRQQAFSALQAIQAATAPDGIAIVNVLIEGTTYTDMFEPGQYHLFTPRELAERFAGWTLLEQRSEDFPAPNAKLKRFVTVIAQQSAQCPGARKTGCRSVS